jgi:hypothetical protein
MMISASFISDDYYQYIAHQFQMNGIMQLLLNVIHDHSLSLQYRAPLHTLRANETPVIGILQLLCDTLAHIFVARSILPCADITSYDMWQRTLYESHYHALQYNDMLHALSNGMVVTTSSVCDHHHTHPPLPHSNAAVYLFVLGLQLESAVYHQRATKSVSSNTSTSTATTSSSSTAANMVPTMVGGVRFDINHFFTVLCDFLKHNRVQSQTSTASASTSPPPPCASISMRLCWTAMVCKQQQQHRRR